ncbi:hypothetical protein AMTR_s00012p00256570 [Amborella trichopoda]|uniref:Uncharacterized protein n=1 Tax=Amborella trichopoda TaxID=13333 RepID=W1PJU8_AMBTC|nr:hypothetical protein AMTR_s00012p00256570 [Amborella trichopoda]
MSSKDKLIMTSDDESVRFGGLLLFLMWRCSACKSSSSDVSLTPSEILLILMDGSINYEHEEFLSHLLNFTNQLNIGLNTLRDRFLLHKRSIEDLDGQALKRRSLSSLSVRDYECTPDARGLAYVGDASHHEDLVTRRRWIT